MQPIILALEPSGILELIIDGYTHPTVSRTAGINFGIVMLLTVIV